MRTHSSSRKQIAKILEDHAGKKSVPELAKELGLSIGYLRCTAQSYGISMAMPPKVSEHEKGLMRLLRAEGMTLAEIAEKFECGIKFVSTACEGIKKGRKAA
jgi:DNA-binding CsgD family transcriptional regulator